MYSNYFGQDGGMDGGGALGGAQIILQQTANAAAAAAAGLAVAKTLRCNSGASTNNSRSGCPVEPDVHCAASCLRCGWLERKSADRHIRRWGCVCVLCVIETPGSGDPAFNQQMRCCPLSHARASISCTEEIFDDKKYHTTGSNPNQQFDFN
ncbi:hypothetical protein EYF80_047515 [Liparis tanakae]|uniref:Uncharacterized protein n=1 Tax=Liparis tanakae TaxID=230148 RepID=A0A4Z2FNI1_9TELE|nr:hypothetical protein EYF80_047515 [Liparis tanakae]